MTNPSDSAPQKTPQPSPIPEESIGTILQRGGQELAIEKISDRFTIRPVSPTAAEELTRSLPARRSRRIPRTQLEEFSVDPQQRDEVMAAARNNEGVMFAGHVYQLKNNQPGIVYLSDQLTIQFTPDTPQDQIEAIAQAFGLQQVQPVIGIPNTFVFRVTPEATENPIKITNRLVGRTDVLTAEPNIIVPQEPYYRPRDPLYPRQWYLYHTGGSSLAAGSHIDVENAWDLTRGNRSIVVAITDDAIDLNHPDFQGPGKIVAPKDFKERDFLPLPTNSGEKHGTACAGVAVAEENGTGIVGVAPGCALMPIRTSGFLDDTSIEQLFEWAVDNGASVISCSWGPAAVKFPLSLRQRAALTRAATQGRNGKGCVIVFAAGNANRPVSGTIYERGWKNNVVQGPTEWLSGFAVHPDLIAVSACTSLGKKSAYSNWGNQITVCAPSNNAPPGMWFPQTGYISTAPEVRVPLYGLGVFSTDLLGQAGYETGDFVGNFGGTSSACPVVAGVAALVLSANPNLTAREVKQLLQETADKIVDRDGDPQLGMRLGSYDNNGHSQWFGYGKVNAYRAVYAAQQQLKQPASVGLRRFKGTNNNSYTIPDGSPQGVDSAIRVTENALLQEIQVAVDLEHEFLGDIEISLKSPTGQIVLLQARTLGSRTRLQTTYSSDTIPALGLLLYKPVTGVWQLQVVDHVPADTGTLKSWELVVGV